LLAEKQEGHDLIPYGLPKVGKLSTIWGMPSFASPPLPPSNDTPVWRVSTLTAYLRELFESDPLLQQVTITGEISNLTRARSGHLYFTLKDEVAQLKAVMWRTGAERLLFEPREGDAVLVHGRVSIYEASGVYQLYIEQMHPAGRGDLALAFEHLKQKLDSEGLFAAEHKQPLPPFPRQIGIVTSRDAAALRDMLNVLRRRYPIVKVLLAPTLVQGAQAPAQIVQAIRWLDGRDDVDLLIVARGGGSIEDLWAFNDEAVARAIFAARHPVISGVGHETDFTIADFVADVRAPTPSAAAELAVPDVSELRAVMQTIQGRLKQLHGRVLLQKTQQLQTLSRALGYLGPRAQLDQQRQQVDALTSRLDKAIAQRLERGDNQRLLLQTRLTAVNPLAVLQRGYAIVRHAETGVVIRESTAVVPATPLHIQLADGTFTAISQ
jgi:exodeoxyribonuclease VII large subunit